MCGLEFPTDSNLIVGLDRADDAGVYRVTDDIALIQTVDFFTPIVDDPYRFGQIAAANALSDVYAMGGTPKTAMNLVAFPLKTMDISILRRIIAGGLATLREAGVVLVGGHSIEDRELKYGLSVTGYIHPDRVLTKKNLRRGDALVLTKPLGTGIITTAVKGGMVSAEVIERVTLMMTTLNRDAARVMGDFPVHACTDVTGFGLLGHLAEMVADSALGVRVDAGSVPVFPEAWECAKIGMVPGGALNNRRFREPLVEWGPSIDPVTKDVLFDPQTSGGLLIAVGRDHAQALLQSLADNGIGDCALIGEVVCEPKGKIRVE